MNDITRENSEKYKAFTPDEIELIKEITKLEEKNKEMRFALNQAHKTFGNESDRLGNLLLKSEAQRLLLVQGLEKLAAFDSNPSGSGPAYTQCAAMVRLAKNALKESHTDDLLREARIDGAEWASHEMSQEPSIEFKAGPTTTTRDWAAAVVDSYSKLEKQ